jgi:hypothetical protein
MRKKFFKIPHCRIAWVVASKVLDIIIYVSPVLPNHHELCIEVAVQS